MDGNQLKEKIADELTAFLGALILFILYWWILGMATITGWFWELRMRVEDWRESRQRRRSGGSRY